MLTSAHQGYIYQDILGAYFIANELAIGKGETRFLFDQKKTPKGFPDKFDDLVIYRETETVFIQVKYSNDENQHNLTKQDFSSSSAYDLALFDLFETWKALHETGCIWRICLAWDQPVLNDPILTVLTQLPDKTSFLPGTICYQFNLEKLWSETEGVLPSWKTLKTWSLLADRFEFGKFLDCLVLEIGCPKSTLLLDYSNGLEKLLSRTIERIGIGIYPNDHLNVRQVAESFCTIARSRRATPNSVPISCNEIAKSVNIELSNGGIEQYFPVDQTVLITTRERVDQVIDALDKHRRVILTAEPGAGKSWFIEDLQASIKETTQVIKHYCYTALEDSLAIKRITVNVLYGSLITQILHNDGNLSSHMTKRYASNLDELNILLRNIQDKTLLIIDGIDHIWRVYQKNRGGLTEDETTILKALAKLDFSNPNISLLVVSQPIKQLTEHLPFFHSSLVPLSEQFVSELLEKHHIQNSKVEEVSLAELIHIKSNGNALYCKYLIDHAILNKSTTSFEWIDHLPAYEFNLTGYYKYLFEQIQGYTGVPYAFCGADFSLNEDELKEITHLGSMVEIQLDLLLPVLKYVPAIGSSIYHESFKRFIIDSIIATGASIEHLIYRPLIAWLKTHAFYESTKAYGHLLKLYYEISAYKDIANTISIEFIENSLYYAQPLQRIIDNHRLHRASLTSVLSFAPILIVSEQAKIIYELKNVEVDVQLSYLKAVQAIHGDQAMYRVLWDGENLLVDASDALKFLVSQAYLGKQVVHWSIIPKGTSISYELLGYFAINLICTKEYEKFEELIKKIHSDENHIKEFYRIIEELEWWSIFHGDSWSRNTPYFRSVAFKPISSGSSLTQVVNQIIHGEHHHLSDDWRTMFENLIELSKISSEVEREAVIKQLSAFNWFRNWLIYLIKITELSVRTFTSKEIIDAFSFLVRDLDPFKGKPRVCDLYYQLSFIRKSFHKGLALCKGDKELLFQCCDLLEKVTRVSTDMKGSISGPLTDEKYLELIGQYLPGNYVISRYEEYYKPLGSRRYYQYVADTAFKYVRVLNNAGKFDDAKEKYKEGIQALTAYGFRKDRTFSEILNCSVPYQKAYGTLTPAWFYELYEMAMTVVTHTDGKSTSHYPIEWFEEFVQVYPDEALRFLVSETLENNGSRWHQENEFMNILEDYPTFFTPSQWFLLSRSLPIISSEKILAHGLSVIEEIDKPLRETYERWLQTIPTKQKGEDSVLYSKNVVEKFKQRFGKTLHAKKEEETESFPEPIPLQLPSEFTDEKLMAFFEQNPIEQVHLSSLHTYVASLSNIDEKKAILRQIARSFKYGRDAEEWLTNSFLIGSEEWLYLNIYLFIYLTDGWYHSLHFTKYIQATYDVDPVRTVCIIREELSQSLSDSKYDYSSLISGNLITSLSKLKIEESTVKELLNLTFQVVKRRLPHPPKSEINQSIFQGLEELSSDEMVVAMLIARLKTLTTEKTQGIIWSLTYIAQTAPETLIKPYYWSFSQAQHLLPIQRAVLLQILKEYVSQENIPDMFINLLIKTFPTGFFLEDQFIRSFVDFNIELPENSLKGIMHQNHPYDKDFFGYIHHKYRSLQKYLGILNGSFRAYEYKRDIINEKYQSYYNRSEKVMTPIVALANAPYEIINNQWYEPLTELSDSSYPPSSCNLDFLIPEIIVQVGSLTKRPSYLPNPEDIPSFEVKNTTMPLEQGEWIILASKEKELFGESFKSKQCRYASRVLKFGSRPNSDDFCYAKYLFKTGTYNSNTINTAPFDQPICQLEIVDQLERSSLLFASPWVINKLQLTIDQNIHSGFQAIDNKKEVIIKLITWKEQYFGSIDDGTEIPRLEGTAVLIRTDWYARLLALYGQVEGWVVLTRSTNKQEV